MLEASFAAKLKDASITAIATVAVGALALMGALATGWFSLASKDQELRVHLVEIAIGILRADPKEDVAPARQWAIDVIERDSGVRFTPEDRAALLHKAVGYDPVEWAVTGGRDEMRSAPNAGANVSPK